MLYKRVTTETRKMVEAKKNERANALKEVKRLCKEFGFTAGVLSGRSGERSQSISKNLRHLLAGKLYPPYPCLVLLNGADSF